MARNQTVTPIINNIFALNRVRKECYYQPIRVDFSPIEKSNSVVESIIPFFNNDQNYFTPAFILKREKASIYENIQTEKNKFEARISHSQKPYQEETPQYKPTDSKYCQLCNQYFADYWDHINDKYHKRMINSSKFNKDIMALCQSFQTQDKEKNLTKTKKIDKKKVDKKIKKVRDVKSGDKASKQHQIKLDQDQLKMNIKGVKQADNWGLQNMQRKSLQQSLKIMLQLGNYSTNMLSNNPFKQIYRQT